MIDFSDSTLSLYEEQRKTHSAWLITFQKKKKKRKKKKKIERERKEKLLHCSTRYFKTHWNVELHHISKRVSMYKFKNKKKLDSVRGCSECARKRNMPRVIQSLDSHLLCSAAPIFVKLSSRLGRM